MEVWLVVIPAADANMRGRPHRPRRLRCQALPPRLPPLLLLLAMVVASASVEGGWSHIPDSALHHLKSHDLTLPADAYKFSYISTGQQQYPEDVRYATLKGVSLCTCHHHCLADLRCMGYEHEEDNRTCGLTDILLPANVTEKTVLKWSTGRRRGISWLGAPCHTDRDCSLLIKGAECGQENTCACQRGWIPLDEMLCRPDAHWIMPPRVPLRGDRLQEVKSVSLKSCQDECMKSTDCWVVEYEKQSRECRLYDTAEQAAGDPLPTGTTSYERRLGRWVGGPPESYTNIAGRLFQLTSKIPSKDAAKACLDVGGVQYVPDSLKLVKRVYKTFNIGSSHIGLGFNDVLEEERFDTADGSALDTVSFSWPKGQPDNFGGNENCGGFLGQESTSLDLNDFPCVMSIKQLCEYIGPSLDGMRDPVTTESQDEDGDLTWLTYDLGKQQQVSRVLYIAPDGASNRMEVVQIRLGEQPDDRSDHQSTLCVHQTAKMVAAGFARRFTCARPLLGRYLHVAQRPASLDLSARIAVFGILQP